MISLFALSWGSSCILSNIFADVLKPSSRKPFKGCVFASQAVAIALSYSTTTLYMGEGSFTLFAPFGVIGKTIPKNPSMSQERDCPLIPVLRIGSGMDS